MSLREEIFEQPEAALRLLDQESGAIKEIARQIRGREIDFIFLAARGSSDNAGLYAKYLFGIKNRIPIALAAPSIFSIYKGSVDLKRSLVLGISQSGQSPDIVSVLEAGKQQGAATLAITNAPKSPLAQAAHYVIDIHAGVEKAVAATKTYSTQLLSIGMLSCALAEDKAGLEKLKALPDYMQQVLKLDEVIQDAVQRYYYMDHCVVLGRGYNYSTAFEWSIKLKELAYVIAEPYSSADFLHGPIAMVEHGFPVLCAAPSGRVYPQLYSLARELYENRKANLLVLSDQEEMLSFSSAPLKLPEGIPEWISPMVAILPAQLFCYSLAKLRGLDIENPRGLSKVTLTE